VSAPVTAPVARPKVLCVDDEPNVLDGLGLHLGRRYTFFKASSGDAALELLAREPDIAVIVSDMQMPAMNGATLLARARLQAPDATRLLLTGQSDLESAIAAVNEGRIFRFLTKPCPSPVLVAAVADAVEQHRLVTAERVLLEQTLLGSVRALTDVLSLSNPTAFGRSARIKELVVALAERLALQPRWQLEMAASLSQLGYVTLPLTILDKAYGGQTLSAEEQAIVDRAPAVTDQLLANIPRLEVVRAILSEYSKPTPPRSAASDADQALVRRGAELLRIAVDFDTLETQGMAADLAIDTLRGRAGKYDAAVVDALAAARGSGSARRLVRELRVAELRVGMIFAVDVKTRGGALLVSRGYEITASFMERIRNHPGNIAEPLRVIVATGA